VADGKAIGHGLGKGMQDDGAVRIDDTFGETGIAGSEAHGGAVGFVKLGILEIVVGIGEQLLRVQKAFGAFAAAVGNDNHTLERGVFAKFFVGGEKNVVDEEKAVAGVVGDAGNFVGMKPQGQRVQDAAGRGNTEEGFEVAGMVPHHGGDAIAGAEAELGESGSQAAGAAKRVGE